MRVYHVVVLALLSASMGCGNSFRQGPPKDTSPEDTDTDTADTDDTDTDDTDTDDTDTDDTDTDTDPGSGCHPWDPIEEDGWTRVYDVEFLGEAGTETQTGHGEGVSPLGVTTYKIGTELTAGEAGWSNGFVYEDCDVGSEEGVYVREWEVLYKNSAMGGIFDSLCDGMSGFELILCELMMGLFEGLDTGSSGGSEMLPLTARLSIPNRYLPGPATAKAGESWTYSYTLEILTPDDTGALTVMATMTIEGNYIGHGTEDVTVPAGTFEATKYSNQFTTTPVTGSGGLFEDLWASMGTGGVDLRMEIAGIPIGVAEGYSEYYFAKGIGLVKSITYDGDTPFLFRDLKSTSGL